VVSQARTGKRRSQPAIEVHVSSVDLAVDVWTLASGRFLAKLRSLLPPAQPCKVPAAEGFLVWRFFNLICWKRGCARATQGGYGVEMCRIGESTHGRVEPKKSREKGAEHAVARGRLCNGERNVVVRLHVVVDIFRGTNHDMQQSGAGRWSTNRRWALGSESLIGKLAK